MLHSDSVIYVREIAPSEKSRWVGKYAQTPEDACRRIAKDAGLNVVNCVVESDPSTNKTLIDLIRENLDGRPYDELIYPFTLLIQEWSMLSADLRHVLSMSVLPIVVVEDAINRLLIVDEFATPICPLLRPNGIDGLWFYSAKDGPGGCAYYCRKAAGEDADLGEIWSGCFIRHEGGICPADEKLDRLLADADSERNSLIETNRQILAKNCIATHRRLARSAHNRDAYLRSVIEYRLKVLNAAIDIVLTGRVANYKDLLGKLTKAGWHTTDPSLTRQKQTAFTYSEFRRLLDYLRREEPSGYEAAIQRASGIRLPWEKGE